MKIDSSVPDPREPIAYLHPEDPSNPGKPRETVHRVRMAELVKAMEVDDKFFRSGNVAVRNLAGRVFRTRFNGGREIPDGKGGVIKGLGVAKQNPIQRFVQRSLDKRFPISKAPARVRNAREDGLPYLQQAKGVEKSTDPDAKYAEAPQLTWHRHGAAAGPLAFFRNRIPRSFLGWVGAAAVVSVPIGGLSALGNVSDQKRSIIALTENNEGELIGDLASVNDIERYLEDKGTTYQAEVEAALAASPVNTDFPLIGAPPLESVLQSAGPAAAKTALVVPTGDAPTMNKQGMPVFDYKELAAGNGNAADWQMSTSSNRTGKMANSEYAINVQDGIPNHPGAIFSVKDFFTNRNLAGDSFGQGYGAQQPAIGIPGAGVWAPAQTAVPTADGSDFMMNTTAYLMVKHRVVDGVDMPRMFYPAGTRDNSPVELANGETSPLAMTVINQAKAGEAPTISAAWVRSDPIAIEARRANPDPAISNNADKGMLATAMNAKFDKVDLNAGSRSPRYSISVDANNKTQAVRQTSPSSLGSL